MHIDAITRILSNLPAMVPLLEYWFSSIDMSVFKGLAGYK
jgi:hypothetical protein